MRTRVGLLSSVPLLLTSCGGWYNPFAGVRRLISTAILIVDLVIAYDVISSHRSTAAKVAWLALVFLFPIVGALVYLAAGRK